MAALSDPSIRWQIVLRCTICGPLGPLLQIFSTIAFIRRKENNVFVTVFLLTDKNHGTTEAHLCHFEKKSFLKLFSLKSKD